MATARAPLRERPPDFRNMPLTELVNAVVDLGLPREEVHSLRAEELADRAYALWNRRHDA